MPIADYEVVIGLEVHCQLDIQSKMFSACAYVPGAGGGSGERAQIEANALTDPYTWGMPGTLPVPNRAAVDAALRLALALGCAVQPRSRWARKHYFYPDLPKGYQITQAARPYALGGEVEIEAVDGPREDKTWENETSEDEARGPSTRRVPLERIHMEEDAGKNTHTDAQVSLVDYNRAGAALVEIVSLPALRSAAEAASYMRALRELVRCLGISDANMEEGTLRCDANVSLRPCRSPSQPDSPDYPLGTRCEIKNLNSFKFLEAAIEAEIRRQTDLLDRGELVVQSTMSYDPVRDQTQVMRTKEAAADYRYFPEPDIPPLIIDAAWIADASARLPELPWDRRRRLVGVFGLSAYDAGVLSAEVELARYFDASMAALGECAGAPNQAQDQDQAQQAKLAKLACNWITGELLKLLNSNRGDIAQCPVSPGALAELITLVESGEISTRGGKQVLEKVYKQGLSPAEIVERDGLRQVSDTGAIAALVAEVMDANPDQLAQLLAGKAKVRGFFVGQIMRKSKGQANPQLVQAAIDAALAARGGG